MKDQPITGEQVVAAVKLATITRTKEWAAQTHCACDRLFASNGPMTSEVARHLGVGMGKAKALLDKAENANLLAKNSRGGQCRWWPIGYLAELKKAAKSASQVAA